MNNEIPDQAGFIGLISYMLPESWKQTDFPTQPNMAMIMPSGGLRHANGDIVIPKLEFIPDKETLTYAQVFERYGVTDLSVLLCQLIARKKVWDAIDIKYEIPFPVKMDQIVLDKRTFSRIWLDENFFNHGPEP